MTIYSLERDEIRSGIESVGWFNDQIHNRFDCILAIRNVLKNHSHDLNIKLFIGSIGEYTQVDPVIREVEIGYYISDRFDNINYAYFSKDMKCAKSCASAVLKVMMS